MDQLSTKVTIEENQPETLDVGEPKEIVRKRYFETMQKPRPETLKQLENWKEPKGAYVLFEVPKANIDGKGMKELTYGLYILPVEHRPQQWHKLNDIINSKNARVLHYGNFPTADDTKPGRAHQWRLHSDGRGTSHYDVMKRHVQNAMNQGQVSASMMNTLRETNDALQAEVDELRAQFQKDADANQDKQDGKSKKKGS